MRSPRHVLAVILMALSVSLLSSRSGWAAVASFTFDGHATADGALTSLTLTDGGLTATFTRPGSVFEVRDLSVRPPPPAPSLFFGTGTLSPFGDFASATPFIVDFSQPSSR